MQCRATEAAGGQEFESEIAAMEGDYRMTVTAINEQVSPIKQLQRDLEIAQRAVDTLCRMNYGEKGPEIAVMVIKLARYEVREA